MSTLSSRGQATAARLSRNPPGTADRGLRLQLVLLRRRRHRRGVADPAQPHFRMIRVMCSGRIQPGFVLRAFEQGADACWCRAATSETATTSSATSSR